MKIMKRFTPLLKGAFLVVLFLGYSGTASAFAENSVFSKALARGASGPEVTALQEFLKTMPDVYPEESVTGYFGPLTEKAVKRFQSKYGLESIGIVGPKTRKKFGELFSHAQNTNQSQSALPPRIQTGPTFAPGTGKPFDSNTRNWNAPTSGSGGGILYAENLPSCQGTELFNALPAVDDTYDTISPLGQTSANHGSPGHVFPVDHVYFNFKHVISGDYSSPSLPTTVLSPGDIEIFQINTITYEKDGKNIGNDYHLYFAPCREVTAYFGHLSTLSSQLQNAIDHADQKSCGAPFITGSPANTTLKPCSYSLLLNVKSGEEIGTAGGPGAVASSFDFGVYDQRIQSLPFINPKYWTPLNLHTVCGLHYYPDGSVKTSLLNKINNAKKDAGGFPDCGTNMWDRAHTAQGNWVLPNTPIGRVPDMQGLAAVHLNTDPSQGLIDWGGAIAPADRIQFSIAGSGVINRDPADVKADGSVYCFQDTSQGTTYARSVKLQLVDDNTLKAEYLAGACPSFPAFSSPTTYFR